MKYVCRQFFLSDISVPMFKALWEYECLRNGTDAIYFFIFLVQRTTFMGKEHCVYISWIVSGDRV